MNDGSAGDANYGRIGLNYASYRRPDERIATAIVSALGCANRVLNVGAGAGSYEPTDREVVAVEPSSIMRQQRAATSATVINAVAESLPFQSGSFDASMSTFSVHQWRDLELGLAEMRRVTTGPVLILTCDPRALTRFWLVDYAPEVLQVEERRYPGIHRLTSALGASVSVDIVPIPLDCSDGFGEAYYGRPEELLKDEVRLAQSAWSFVPQDVVERFNADLSRDLASGAWDSRYGHLRSQPYFEGSLRLVISS